MAKKKSFGMMDGEHKMKKRKTRVRKHKRNVGKRKVKVKTHKRKTKGRTMVKKALFPNFPKREKDDKSYFDYEYEGVDDKWNPFLIGTGYAKDFAPNEKNIKEITDDERDYIIDTYGLEPEDLPQWEVDEAIEDRRGVE